MLVEAAVALFLVALAVMVLAAIASRAVLHTAPPISIAVSRPTEPHLLDALACAPFQAIIMVLVLTGFLATLTQFMLELDLGMITAFL